MDEADRAVCLRALLVDMWKQGDDFLNSCPVFVDFSSRLVTIILAGAPFPAGIRWYGAKTRGV